MKKTVKIIWGILKAILVAGIAFCCLFFSLICFDFFKDRIPEKYSALQDKMYTEIRRVYHKITKENIDYLPLIEKMVADQNIE